MKKKNTINLLTVLENFKKILENKPTTKKMVDEVRMMNFRIRPVHGDITLLNLKNRNFIEVLWSLGKLDEFYQKEAQRVPLKQQEFFFKMVDNLQNQFERRLNTVKLKGERPSKASTLLEMEIIKEHPDRRVS